MYIIDWIKIKFFFFTRSSLSLQKKNVYSNFKLISQSTECVLSNFCFHCILFKCHFFTRNSFKNISSRWNVSFQLIYETHKLLKNIQAHTNIVCVVSKNIVCIYNPFCFFFIKCSGKNLHVMLSRCIVDQENMYVQCPLCRTY